MAPTKKTMFLLLCLLVAAVAVVLPIAQGAVNVGPALFKGIVFCTPSGNGVVGSSPPYPNAPVAIVELPSGSGIGRVVSTGVTNSTGRFAIYEKNVTATVAQVLSNYRVVVVRTLKKCSFSVGTLTSKLALNGTMLNGTVNVTVFTPIKFSPIPLP